MGSRAAQGIEEQELMKSVFSELPSTTTLPHRTKAPALSHLFVSVQALIPERQGLVLLGPVSAS